MAKSHNWNLDCQDDGITLKCMLMLDGKIHASIEFVRDTMGPTQYCITSFEYDDLVTDDDKSFFIHSVIPLVPNLTEKENRKRFGIIKSNDRGVKFIENYLTGSIHIIE